jgi:hypothetical protein
MFNGDYMFKESILGPWELVSCVGESREGDSFLPYGEQPVGKLIYTEGGHLAVVLMNSARSPFASEDISKATIEEAAAAFNTFDAYAGRWNLDPDTGRIEHTIECGRIPNWVGKTHTRFSSVQDEELTLSTEEFSMAGKMWQVHVRWRRASNWRY